MENINNPKSAQPVKPVKKNRRWPKILLVVVIIFAAIVLVGWMISSQVSKLVLDDYDTVSTGLSGVGTSTYYDDSDALYEVEGIAAAPTASESKSSVDSAAGEIADNATDQKVIKTGGLDLVVQKVDDSINDITSAAKAAGGFVEDSQMQSYSDDTKTATMTVRVPADRFEETLAKIKDLAVKVRTEETSGQDVTEEFVDLQSRLKNYQRTEERYLEVLTQAVTIEDILKVDEKIASVRANIESLQGQISYLENLTSMSTITAYMIEEAKVDFTVEDWNPWSTIKEASTAWLSTAEAVIDGVIWLLIYLIPLGLIIWLAVWVIKRTVRCMRNWRAKHKDN